MLQGPQGLPAAGHAHARLGRDAKGICGWTPRAHADHSRPPGCCRVSQGVPIRLELGAKDMEAGSCVLARRDTGAKEACALADVASRVPALLEQIQARQ